ncbi:UDP-N-acetylmuramoyl-tripeptide--D-alanyl-D-alanine ligase [Spirochaetia bacterium]|nr:UDP-N-acetylmuramoyl-tripeptide--D-alanyl-D-alanine ligase [Spirochaetia bacterium]
MGSGVLMRYTRLNDLFSSPERALVSFAGDDASAGFSSVSIDSRTVQPGALFIALIGAAQDGHKYVEAAFKSGAGAAMVARSRLDDSSLGLEESARKAGARLVVVENTLAGLQETAAAYLDGFPSLLKIGITGSSGKTTTKEIAAAMIGREKAVVINPGNLNSETGLPLSVFEVRARHEVGIFEMGMNRRGEIAELAKVLKPHLALITNIGTSHIGILGSKHNIVEEKKQIFSEFTGNETALIPEDDEYRDALAEGVRGKVVFYGPENLEELEGVTPLGLAGAEITWEGVSARFGLPGRHNLKDALAAAAIARAVPVSGEAIREGLASVKPLFGRSEILAGDLPGGGKVTVIRDCYNANPDSAAEAVALCDGLNWQGRRVYVMGSMLELGAASGEAHKKLGRELAASKADMVFLYGKETEAAARVMAGGQVPCHYTDTMSILSRKVAEYVRGGDLVLLKGSRGCALEQLTGVLIKDGGPF